MKLFHLSKIKFIIILLSFLLSTKHLYSQILSNVKVDNLNVKCGIEKYDNKKELKVFYITIKNISDSEIICFSDEFNPTMDLINNNYVFVFSDELPEEDNIVKLVELKPYRDTTFRYTINSFVEGSNFDLFCKNLYFHCEVSYMKFNQSYFNKLNIKAFGSAAALYKSKLITISNEDLNTIK